MKYNKILTIAILGLLITTTFIVTSKTTKKDDGLSIEVLGSIRTTSANSGEVKVTENYAKTSLGNLGFDKACIYENCDNSEASDSKNPPTAATVCGITVCNLCPPEPPTPSNKFNEIELYSIGETIPSCQLCIFPPE